MAIEADTITDTPPETVEHVPASAAARAVPPVEFSPRDRDEPGIPRRADGRDTPHDRTIEETV